MRAEAAEQVIKCRQVLKYTYVHGYYLTNTLERNLFEHLQEMLEKHTEHLHGLVETPLKIVRGHRCRGFVLGGCHSPCLVVVRSTPTPRSLPRCPSLTTAAMSPTSRASPRSSWRTCWWVWKVA